MKYICEVLIPVYGVWHRYHNNEAFWSVFLGYVQLVFLLWKWEENDDIINSISDHRRNGKCPQEIGERAEEASEPENV